MRDSMASIWADATRAAVAKCGDRRFLLNGRLVDVQRAGDILRDLRFGETNDHDLPKPIVQEELHHIPFPNRGGRLHPLPVDLDVAPSAGLRGVHSVLEEADPLEPVVDPMSFHKLEL